MTLRECGEEFNLSRERIRQILERAGIDTSARGKRLRDERTCPVCKRLLKKWGNRRGKCSACFHYFKSPHNPNGRMRTITYPKNCKNCGKQLMTGKKRKGICNNCSTRLTYKKNPVYRKKHHEYTRLYYKKNQIWAQEYARQYYIKKSLL